MRKWIAAAVLMSLMSGCTTAMKTRPGYQVTPLDEALTTRGYSLPMLQYDLVIIHKLTSCPPSAATPNGDKLQFKVEAIVSSGYVAGEEFEIDFRALASPLKVSDFVIQHYKDGTLKGINVSAEDKTADVIKSAVEVGTSIASLGVGSYIPTGTLQSSDKISDAATKILVGAPSQRIALTCNDDARNYLAAAAALGTEVETLTGEVDDLSKEIEAIRDRAALKLLKPNDNVRLGQVHDLILPKIEELTAKRAALEKAERKLIYSEDQLWPKNPYDVRGTLPVSQASVKWFGKLLQPIDVPGYDRKKATEAVEALPEAFSSEEKEQILALIEEELKPPSGFETGQICDTSGNPSKDFSACIAKTLGVYAEIESARPDPLPCPSVPAVNQRPCTSSAGAIAARTNVDSLGIFYRDPARGRLRLCDQGTPCRDDGRKAIALTEWDSIPQLGQLRFARFTNGPFQNNLLALSLREDGSTERFQYGEKSSVLATMADAASTSISAIDTAKQERDERRKKQVADYRADVTYLRSERAAERNEAAAVRTDELAQLQNEIDHVNKQRLLLEARMPADVTQDYKNETTRLEAIAAQLRAKIAIKQAEETLAK